MMCCWNTQKLYSPPSEKQSCVNMYCHHLVVFKISVWAWIKYVLALLMNDSIHFLTHIFLHSEAGNLFTCDISSYQRKKRDFFTFKSK